MWNHFSAPNMRRKVLLLWNKNKGSAACHAKKPNSLGRCWYKREEVSSGAAEPGKMADSHPSPSSCSSPPFFQGRERRAFFPIQYFSSFSCAPPAALLANGQRLPWPSDWLFYHNTTPAYIFFRYWESVFRKPFYIRNWFSSWRGDSATEPAIRKCLPHLRGDQNV